MNEPPIDPTEPQPSDLGSQDGPPLLSTIDPSSALGKELRKAIERLRFADVDRKIQDMAQDVLDGKKGVRDMLVMPEMKPLEQQAAEKLQSDIASLTDEEREQLLHPKGGPDVR